MQVVLGSTSPYKKALLEKLGITFTTADSGVDEKSLHASTVAETVGVLAEAKAQALLPRYAGTDTIIITADVMGELDGKFLGKPDSLVEAKQMLLSYSDRKVFIWCGTSVADAQTGVVQTDIRKATIWFNPLTEKMVDEYSTEQQPLDKGGALAIEEVEQRGWVKEIVGEYDAIIGLSLEFVRHWL